MSCFMSGISETPNQSNVTSSERATKQVKMSDLTINCFCAIEMAVGSLQPQTGHEV